MSPACQSKSTVPTNGASACVSLNEPSWLIETVAGIVMSGPGVPGPGIVTIVIGLGFLALEFDWAERWLERVIIWGDRAAERAEQTTTKQRVLAGIATALAIGAFAAAAILWDIPLMPVL